MNICFKSIMFVCFLGSYSFADHVDAGSKSILDLAKKLGSLRNMTQKQFNQEARAVLLELQNHPDANKPLHVVASQREDVPNHYAVYVKYWIFTYLLNKECTSDTYKQNIVQRHNNVFDCEEWDKEHPSWGSRQPGDTTVYTQYFWSSRIDINNGQSLSKGTLSASRYFADTVYQGLMNPRSHQVNEDIPFNLDPENKLTLLDLLSIAEQAEMQEAQDWKDLDKEVQAVENAIALHDQKCKRMYWKEWSIAQQPSRNPQAAFVRACQKCYGLEK